MASIYFTIPVSHSTQWARVQKKTPGYTYLEKQNPNPCIIMHLLEMKRPGKFSLVEVDTHNTLPYAILSHTWIQGQEVTYKDINSGAGKGKTGYEKIKFCGEQANQDGLRYFWVDTCCIDKSNSTELNTAINSMFRWYQNAKKCYVYLADVSAPGFAADVQARQSTWEAAFRESKWFKRGWTLQELIAPTTVEFFSKERKRLGDKKTLEKTIHEITKIPIQALRGNPFSDFSIAERKEWVLERRTTKEEDMVYCLLGLCEVVMPPIYGEGMETAMKRLQMTIREFSRDSSNKPNDLEDNVVRFIVPFERNPKFTGRESQLAKIEDKLWRGDRTTKVAIWGLGGVGKTQLVLEIVYRIKHKHKNCFIIWIPATNMESLYQAYLDIAQQLKIPGLEADQADAKKLVQDYMSKESVGQWLLVFDNADDIDMWIAESGSQPGSGRLIEYLPRSERGCILFTTRDRRIAVKLAHQDLVEVPQMEEDVAKQLLQTCLNNPDLGNSELDTKALLERLTYLPLAIIQAAAYINENGIRLADYLSLLEYQEQEVIDLLSEEFEDDGRYRNVKNPVATTWLISFEQIKHRDPLAADYLSFMACIDPKDIPQSLLPAAASQKRKMVAIGTLEAYSFVIKKSANLTVDLHRLVHLAMRNWLRKEELITQWTERAIEQLEEVFPDDVNESRSLWKTYLPHVRYVLMSDVVDKDTEKRMDLVQKFGMFLFVDGRFKEAEAQFIEAVDRRERVLGAEHQDTLASMTNLASTYCDLGRWKEAEELEVQVLETSKRVLGAEHPDTLTGMANLASTYRDQGRWKEAEELEVQALETRKRVLGAEHPNTLSSMANLASTYRDQGRWKEAEKLEVWVLETGKRVLGSEHPDILTSTTNLASTYRDLGRWKEAEELEVQVVETSKRVLGAEHPYTLTGMANLASTYRDQGRWKEAEELEVQVVEISKRVLGTEHPYTLRDMGNLASTYRDQGRWKEAEELEVQVLETSKRVLGTEHLYTLTGMANLASTYRNIGRWKEAEELEVQVLETNKRMLGAEHPYTLIGMANLALTFWNQGRWKEAEELEVQVLETSKRVLGAEHPSTLTSMNNLAVTWSSQGRVKDALRLMEECVRSGTSRIGIDHPDAQSSLKTLKAWQAELGLDNDTSSIPEGNAIKRRAPRKSASKSSPRGIRASARRHKPKTPRTTKGRIQKKQSRT